MDTITTYLALGDSYTIGEGVSQAESFPYVLSSLVEAKTSGASIEVKVVAKTGWTTDELSAKIDEEEREGNFGENYSLVTLLIGVNNQYRGPEKGFTQERYEQEFPPLLERALAFAGGKAEKVRVLSVPDWGQTPFGKKSERDLALISTEIDAYNAFASSLCASKNVRFLDITPYSREVAADASFITEDCLHYSGKSKQHYAQAVFKSL